MTDNNSLLRRNSIITEEEVLVITGDLYVAENAITRERRILDRENRCVAAEKASSDCSFGA